MEELLLPLVLTVSPPLQASPAALSESCALGTTTAATITVKNRASAAVAWTAAASASWITASPASGTSLAAGASVTVSLTLGAGLVGRCRLKRVDTNVDRNRLVSVLYYDKVRETT